MTPQLRVVLREHKLAMGARERVFLSRDGQLLNSNRVKHHLSFGIRAAGVKRIRFHDLRHSFASQLVIAGASIYKVQKLLGHQDVKTTMRHAHLSPEAQADVVRLLEDNAGSSAARLHRRPGRLMHKCQQSLEKKWWRRWESNPRPRPLRKGVYVCSLLKANRSQVKRQALGFGRRRLEGLFIVPPRCATARFRTIRVVTRPNPSPRHGQVRTALLVFKQRERSACCCWHLDCLSEDLRGSERPSTRNLDDHDPVETVSPP